MVTIIKHSDNHAEPIIDLDTVEAAEEWLDRLAGSYWGLPGMTARKDAPGILVITARPIGDSTHTLSTYKIEAA